MPDSVSSTQFGGGAGKKVIAIYTKQHTFTKTYAIQRDQVGIINFKHPGYSKAREFYVPKYDTNTHLEKTPDYRRILYWNPSVNLSDKKKTSISFFTSDESAKYRIEIEGLTTDGKVVLGEYKFEVNNDE